MQSLAHTLLRRFCPVVIVAASGMVVTRHQAEAQLTPVSPPATTQSQAASQSTSTSTSVEVTGVVLDSRNHAPIPRALVRFGSRAVLTDHNGVFDLPEVTQTTVSLSATKPGYYPNADGDQGGNHSYSLPLTKPVELLLYPEAILSGNVTNSSGEGLSGLSVTAQKSVFDDSGRRWNSAGQAQTTSDGSFRLTVPSGSYMLRIAQRGRGPFTKEIVMPLAVPDGTSTQDETLHLAPGQDVHLDLRADVRPAYQVNFRVEPETRGFPALRARTASGAIMPLSAMPAPGSPGEFRVALPRGSYSILGSMQNQEGLSEAHADITVADHELSGLTLQFTHAATLPLVVDADSSANLDSAKLPDPAQLGLVLNPVGESMDGNSQAIYVGRRRNSAPSFEVPDGVYHLHAQSAAQWYVVSATCGGVDLLAQDLPVSSGLDGTEVRVRVSNNTATLSGKVTLDGSPARAWIYLLPSAPSATPILTVRANSDGSFTRTSLPPGDYRALAMERKIAADLQSTETLNHYLDRVQTFTVTPGEQHTLVLAAVPERDLPQ